jgi:hypothetical protein
MHLVALAWKTTDADCTRGISFIHMLRFIYKRISVKGQYSILKLSEVYAKIIVQL